MQSLLHTKSSQPDRTVPGPKVFSVPCYLQLLRSLLLQYCSTGLEVFCLNCSGEYLLATCALNARSAGGVIEELSFVAGDNHTEQLNHAFTSLLPIDLSSLECIHACQHPSDAWYLQSNNRTFRIKTYLAAPGQYFCSPKWIFKASLEYKWFVLKITRTSILSEILFALCNYIF